MAISATKRRTLKDYLGFAPGAIPFIIALGLVYLVATMPSLFGVLADLPVQQEWGRWGVDHLHAWSDTWAAALSQPGVEKYDRLVTQGALICMPLLWIAALIRSIRVQTGRPLAVTVIASIGGLLAVPFVSWVCEVGVVIYRTAHALAGLVRAFVSWIAPVLVVLFLIAAGLFVLFLLYWAISVIHEERLWAVVGVVAAVAALLTAVVGLGLLDGFLSLLSGILDDLAAWIVRYVAPVAGWLIQALFILLIALVGLGVIVAILGQVGRTVYLPIASAVRSGRDQGKCIDLAAGVGLSFSLILCAAVTDGRFGGWLEATWQDTPVIGHTSAPVGFYDWLLPGAAEDLLRSSFGQYTPTVSASLLLLVTFMAILSLLLQMSEWKNEHGARIALPVMIVLGIAIAGLIPVLLIMAWLNNADTG